MKTENDRSDRPTRRIFHYKHCHINHRRKNCVRLEFVIYLFIRGHVWNYKRIPHKVIASRSCPEFYIFTFGRFHDDIWPVGNNRVINENRLPITDLIKGLQIITTHNIIHSIIYESQCYYLQPKVTLVLFESKNE